MRKIVSSPLSGKIYYAVGHMSKKDPDVFIAQEKEDMTDDAVFAVFSWMRAQCKRGESGVHFDIKYEGIDGVLSFDLQETGPTAEES